MRETPLPSSSTLSAEVIAALVALKVAVEGGGDGGLWLLLGLLGDEFGAGDCHWLWSDLGSALAGWLACVFATNRVSAAAAPVAAARAAARRRLLEGGSAVVAVEVDELAAQRLMQGALTRDKRARPPLAEA
jgi:hypothetical protein